jgi:hypothetical protein
MRNDQPKQGQKLMDKELLRLEAAAADAASDAVAYAADAAAAYAAAAAAYVALQRYKRKDNRHYRPS